MQNEHRNSVIVTSLNEAKMVAVRNVIKDFFPEITQVIGVASQSMVSETPIGDEEAIAGCRNRIPFARRAYPDAAYFVSIEGAIDFNTHGAFVYSWVLVEQRDPDRQALGSSAKVQLPAFLAQGVEKGSSLSELTKATYQTSANVSNLGTNGVITNGAFTRTDEFETALRCAFGYLSNEVNYRTGS
jgi:inosine/xanthosine triphosphatase